MILITARSLAFRLLLLCLAELPSVSGNVEKEIFVAPHRPDELLFIGTNDGQSVELEALHLGLPKLTPSFLCGTDPCRSLKETLNTSFLGSGETHWILLDNLEPGRRYEVRICWAATSPIGLVLNLYTPLCLFSDPSLITSLVSYTSQALPSPRTLDEVDHVPRSLLYLQIQAKTGYHTHDKSRMKNPDSVDVEIILDPYFVNVIPESLLPTVGMIILATLFACWASGRIYRILQGIGAMGLREDERQEKKDS